MILFVKIIIKKSLISQFTILNEYKHEIPVLLYYDIYIFIYTYRKLKIELFQHL